MTDRDRALECLRRIGYYRLSGYWFAFRERSELVCMLDEHRKKPKKVREERIALDAFRAGTTFQNAVDLCIFDKGLRLLVMNALERIEVALRVDLSHTLGRLDRFAYLKPELFHHEFSIDLDRISGLTRHHIWLGKHAQLISRSKEEFVRHSVAKYGLPLAIWVACEVWDFGTLSTFTFACISPVGTPRFERDRHGSLARLGRALVGQANKKPLSSFRVKTRLLRGAVLRLMLGCDVLRVKTIDRQTHGSGHIDNLKKDVYDSFSCQSN